jgi:hypothetical protein
VPVSFESLVEFQAMAVLQDTPEVWSLEWVTVHHRKGDQHVCSSLDREVDLKHTSLVLAVLVVPACTPFEAN